MPNFCTDCGAELSPKARFCIACGTPVKAKPAADTKTVARKPKIKEVSPTPVEHPRPPTAPLPDKKKSFRPLLIGVLLLIMITGALGGGYFYFNTYQPELLANLKITVTGLFGAGPAEQAAPASTTASTPDVADTTGTGTTTAQIRAQWAEQSLKEGRLKDADTQLKQAEELEPNSASIQALRAKLTEAEEAQRRGEEERRRKEEAARLAREATQKKQATLKSAMNAYNAKRGDEAERLARPMAEAGDAEAQYILGLVYAETTKSAFMGLVRGSKDPAESIKWFRNAAEQGHTDAQRVLGNSYRQGIYGVIEKNYDEAIKWYRKAAENGNAAAMINLANMYLHGEGVSRDKSQARYWLEKAAAQGHQAAKILLRTL